MHALPRNNLNFLPSLLTVLLRKEILSVPCRSPVVAVDNGIVCRCYVPETVGTLTLFLLVFCFFLFPLVMVMWESKFSAMVVQYFKSET